MGVMLRSIRALLFLALTLAACGPLLGEGPSLLDQLGDAVDAGDVSVELDLLPGRQPVNPGWDLEVAGTPRAVIAAKASAGKITKFDLRVEGGDVVLVGHGLMPAIVLQEIGVDENGVVSAAKFHGRGFGRLVVAIFRGPALKIVRKMKFHTDLPSLFRGDLIVREAAPQPSGSRARAGSEPPASAPPGAEPSKPAGSFLDLVGTIRFHDSSLSALPRKRLSFGSFCSFQTASAGEGGTPLSIRLDSGEYRRERDGNPSGLDLDARLDGNLEDGSMQFGADRVAFRRGRFDSATVQVRSGAPGEQTAIAAARLELELTSGRFVVPGGVAVSVAAPSRFSARDLKVEPDGAMSGTVDLDLSGETGEFATSQARVALRHFHVASKGLVFQRGKATGDVALGFDYRLEYPMVIRYPVPELSERRVPLVFAGPLAARLHVAGAGAGGGGTVEGSYSFKVPWPPIEKAVLEVLRAKWTQDVSPIREVDFTIEPMRFTPCGGSCFLSKFRIIAEKGSAAHRLFRQVCEPEGKADLFIDPAARSFQLRKVVVETHCEGVLGWFANRIAPFFAKSYDDVTLFRIPDDVPFSIDTVRSGVDWLEISGGIDWAGTRVAPSADRKGGA